MRHEQLGLKAVLLSTKYNKQLNKEDLLKKYSKLSDSLLKAAIDEMILIHAEEPADEYESEPEYYEYEHYNDYLWNM